MKSIFNKADRDEIIERIGALDKNRKPGWGKMSVEQMVNHCILSEEYYFGRVAVKRSFLGRIFGKMALKSELKPGKTMLRKNSPSPTSLLVAGPENDLENQKNTWKALIERYSSYPSAYFSHWFFGKMTKEQLGQFVYLHCNHHLTQFNA
jgi:Protein of unknown function (DUF1569)